MTKYSLVFQFLTNESCSFEKLIDLEELLEKSLHGLATVDGHDCGSGEMNIFIFTDQPQKTFERAKFIVNAARMLPFLSAAYRLAAEDEYTRLWPFDSIGPFSVK